MHNIPDVTFYPSSKSVYRWCKRRHPDNPLPSLIYYHCLWPIMAATTTSTSAVVSSPNRHNHNELDLDPDPVREFWCVLDENENIALSVAAMVVLTGVIRRSSASTVMGMEREIREVANLLIGNVKFKIKSVISLCGACELFIRYVTRTSLDFPDFERCKAQLLARGERMAQMSATSRERIASLGEGFVRDGVTILTHGNSRVVLRLLLRAAQTKRFSVIIPESKPSYLGFELANRLHKAGIPVRVILDSSVAYFMERVDMIIVGAESVVENGGVVSQIGTFQIAMIAKGFNKSFYVAAESHKFTRLYPLNQQDFPAGSVPFVSLSPPIKDSNDNKEENSSLGDGNPCVDYTPSKYITLLFTDLGVLTPSAVSDELIRLHH